MIQIQVEQTLFWVDSSGLVVSKIDIKKFTEEPPILRGQCDSCGNARRGDFQPPGSQEKGTERKACDRYLDMKGLIVSCGLPEGNPFQDGACHLVTPGKPQKLHLVASFQS